MVDWWQLLGWSMVNEWFSSGQWFVHAMWLSWVSRFYCNYLFMMLLWWLTNDLSMGDYRRDLETMLIQLIYWWALFCLIQYCRSLREVVLNSYLRLWWVKVVIAQKCAETYYGNCVVFNYWMMVYVHPKQGYWFRRSRGILSKMVIKGQSC